MHLHDGDAVGGRGRPERRFEFAELLLRSHIGPDKTAALARRIGFLLAIERETTAFGFAGLVQDVALNVELPAVIEAAEPTLFIAPEGERGAAMHAVLAENAQATLGVAEDNQVLAEHACA